MTRQSRAEWGAEKWIRRKIRESRKIRGGKIIPQSSLKTGDKTEASEKMYKTKQGGQSYIRKGWRRN